VLFTCPICRRPLQPVLTDTTVYAILGDSERPIAGLQAYSCGPKGHIFIVPPGGNGFSHTADGAHGPTNGAAKVQLLNAWKEIAAYLGRGVRTVQRWERDLGLPVHRPKGRDRSAVLAFPEELDAWLHRTPIRSEFEEGGVQSPDGFPHPNRAA
jgi:hypothetical protein